LQDNERNLRPAGYLRVICETESDTLLAFNIRFLKLTLLLPACLLIQCGQPPGEKNQYPLPDGIVAADSEWQVVGEDYVYTDAPAVSPDGTVYFSDVINWVIYKELADGSLEIFADDTGGSQGMMFAADGSLTVCLNKYAELVKFDIKGEREVLFADKTYPVIGNPKAEPEFCNDLVLAGNGNVYYTDRANRKIWLMRSGEKPVEVASGYRPNGIILTPEQNRLISTDSIKPRLVVFDINSDGTLTEIESNFDPIYTVAILDGENIGEGRSGANGMTVDADGRVYVTTFLGIQVYAPDGKALGVIPRPGLFTSNVTFGGPDFDTLYVTGPGKVYKRKMAVKGAPYFLQSSD